MRVIHPDYGVDIELKENQVLNIAVENSTAFWKLTNDLWNQTNGLPGRLLLQDGEKNLAWTKNAIMISAPYALNYNEKKIVNELHRQLSKEIAELYESEYLELTSKILSFMDSVIGNSSYDITSDDFFPATDLLKCINVRFSEDIKTATDSFIEYIKVVKNLCHISVIIVLNLKQYFDDMTLRGLYEYCFYNKIFLVNVEGQESRRIGGDKYYIIDKDLCIIE